MKILSSGASSIVIITLPTIYESFITKYSALSGIDKSELKGSHRFRAARVGEPLRIFGSDFYFFFTLHTIPCVGFRVEWRGRSVVFTGDHLNNPEVMEELVEKGVMSR